MRPPRCPRCGTTEGLLAEQSYKATGTGEIVGVDDDGTLLVDWIDAGQPKRFYQAWLCCQACGHYWPTARQTRPS